MKNSKTYYYFEVDGTMGYVGEAKMKRMIANWGWERNDFIEKRKILKLFKQNEPNTTTRRF